MFIIEKRIHTKRHYITKDMNNCSILPGTMYKQNRTKKTQSYGAIICVLESNLKHQIIYRTILSLGDWSLSSFSKSFQLYHDYLK
jgi:hypothetical protein